MAVQPANPVQMALLQLPQSCPALASGVDAQQQALLQAFYQAQNDQMVWTDPARVATLKAALAQLADDGLNPAHYPLPAGHDLCADIDTSRQYLKALHDLHFGRLAQSRYEPVWHSDSVVEPDRQAELLALAVPGVQDVSAAFAQARPAFEQYQNLRKVYARMRQQPLTQWQPIPDGPLLRPGMQDTRVPALARRLADEGYLSRQASVNNTYSNEVVSAVKSFQLDHSLQADGVIGPGTIKELNVSPATRRDQLRINLERLRWMAHDFEPTSLLVNVAAAQLAVYKDGQPVWQTRTQVGRPDRQTPLLKSTVNRLTLNPT